MNELKNSDEIPVESTMDKKIAIKINSWFRKTSLKLIVTMIFVSLVLYVIDIYYIKSLIKQSQQTIKEQISQLYKEKNVAQMLDKFIEKKGDDLIEEKIKKQIAPLLDNIREDQKEYLNMLVEFREKKKEYEEMSLLNELITNAEIGDRESFEELKSIAYSPAHKFSRLAFKIVWEITRKYNKQNFQRKHYTDEMADDEILQYLSAKDILKREIAVYTVGKRKLYDQITLLVLMIPNETNLDVLAALYRVLNELLEMDVSIFHRDGADMFMKAWISKEEKLKEKQEKEKQFKESQTP